MPTLTPIYELGLPIVSGDAFTWGTTLNANFSYLDLLLSGSEPITSLEIGTLDVTGATTAAAITASSVVAGAVTGNAVTQTAVDTTAGRLTKVGDFGMGVIGSPDYIVDLDNTALPTGLYRITSATVGTRPPGIASSSSGTVVVTRFSSTVSSELLLASTIASNNYGAWRRNCVSGVWSPWVSFAAELPVGAANDPGIYFGNRDATGFYSIDATHIGYSSSDTLAITLDPAGTDMSGATSAVTKEKADARYGLKSVSDTLVSDVAVLNARPRTAAYGVVANSGSASLTAGYGVASISRTSTGRVNVVFSAALPSANYAISITPNGNSSAVGGYIAWWYNKTTSGFTVGTGDNSSDIAADLDFDFTVTI